MSDIPEMTLGEQWEVRKFIAINHEDSICHIYGDDGELYCGNTLRHGRALDFRREPIGDLLNNIAWTRMKELGNIKTELNPDQIEKEFSKALQKNYHE